MCEEQKLINFYGADILASEGMQREKKLLHHRRISCYQHSLRVADRSIRIARSLHLRVDISGLIRGALLHDYFLYDWRKRETWHRLHGFRHARCALRNASAEFSLTPVERDIIVKHMFPLNVCPPRYRESWIVTLADKICAVEELLPPTLLELRPEARE